MRLPTPVKITTLTYQTESLTPESMLTSNATLCQILQQITEAHLQVTQHLHCSRIEV
jgi:hypothetical protein